MSFSASSTDPPLGTTVTLIATSPFDVGPTDLLHPDLAAAGAATLVLIVLVVALVSPGPGASAAALSPALAAAPPGLVAVAFQEGPATGIDPNVLLAIAKVETDWGQARNGQPDDLVPDDIRASVNVTELQPGGATMSLLGLTGGRRIGDWVNLQPVGPTQEHAMGFMQFLPSTWRVEAAAAPGSPLDPYQPADALLTAGSYLHRLETGAAGGLPHGLRGALAVYGGSLAYADPVLSLALPPRRSPGCQWCSRSRRLAGSSASRSRSGRPTSPRT
jgi:hypothetical protein